MYDIKQLESEWKKYRKKRLKPWYIAGVSLVLITILGIVFYGNLTIDFSKVTSFVNHIKLDEKEITKDVNNNVLLSSALTVLEVEKVKRLVDEDAKKNVQTLKAIEKDSMDTSNVLVDVPILDSVTHKPVNLVDTPKNKKSVQIDIVETSSITAYKDVENRFFVSRDVEDALFLAKSYYKKELYEKAEFWALETNKIDDSIEESLLIFAKSKAKLGHKNEAIGILSNYIRKTVSKDAQDILSRIENDAL